MRRTSVLNYAFSVGKVRALERFLIRQEVFEEAIASNLNEALRLFAESGVYSDELLHIRDSQHLEVVLDRELAKLKQLISNLLLDKALLSLLEFNSQRCIEDILKTYQSDFLEDYLRHLIDMYNIKTFLRLYFLKEPPEKLKENLSCAGFIKVEDFLKLYSQGLAIFLNHLEYVHKDSQILDYASILREPIEKLQQEESFVSLERVINDFLIQILKPAKYITFGPEPLLAYYFARINEMNLVRMVILAKLNSVSADLVKERLNSVYA